jgi:hypothetical protein
MIKSSFGTEWSRNRSNWKNIGVQTQTLKTRIRALNFSQEHSLLSQLLFPTTELERFVFFNAQGQPQAFPRETHKKNGCIAFGGEKQLCCYPRF